MKLVRGASINCTAAWLGREPAAHGFDVIAGAVVGDNIERIAAFIRAALERSEALVITGGLGPTQDDLTREALAAVADVELVRDETIVEALFARARDLGRELPQRNLRQ